MAESAKCVVKQNEPKMEREASFDQVRKLVRKEGIEAKNLVSYHVPLNETLSVDIHPDFDDEHGSEGQDKTEESSKNLNEQSGKCTIPVSLTNFKNGTKKSDFRARHWSYLFDNLRRTVDAIYDTCYFDQSVIECKEAIMVLENCTKDFQALIEYFNNQAVWEKSEKRTAIAWEVRKTTGSPIKHLIPEIANLDPISKTVTSDLGLTIQNSERKPAEIQLDGQNGELIARFRRRQRVPKTGRNICILETVILPSAKSNIDDCDNREEKRESDDYQKSNSKISESMDIDSNQKKILATTYVDETETKGDMNETHEDTKINDDDGWELVSYTRGRRNSESKSDRTTRIKPSTGSNQHQDTTIQVSLGIAPKLSPSASTKPSIRPSIFPRSAQEIRQTKASLGKMNYNRQYLADQRQRELEDKLKMADSRSPINSRRRFGASNSSMSLPTLNNTIGINFSNPEMVKRAARAVKAAILKGGGRSRRFRSYQSMESLQSLESIREEECDGGEKEYVAKVNGITFKGEVTKENVDGELIVGSGGNEDLMEKGSFVQMVNLRTDEQEGSNETGNSIEMVESTTDDGSVQKTEDILIPENQGDTNRYGQDALNVDEPLITSQEMAVSDPDETWKHLTEEEESLAQEEESIQKEMEEERKSIDIEMRRQMDEDDMDDGEIDDVKDLEKNSQVEAHVPATVDSKPMSWQELVERWEAAPIANSTLCWGDMVEMELAEVRSPGQAVYVHEKLSSPSRQRDLTADIKKREERRMKAYEIRQQILEGRHQRMRELSKRVEEVREARRQLVEKKKSLMEERLAKAKENRDQLLLARVKKAHDEEEKVNEIAFINTLEADNKRLDVMTRQQDLESRLQTIQDERQRRCEEKAAREAAAEERRKAAEELRQTRLLDRAERTKRRQEQIEQQKSEQERERQQLAKDKAKEREERLAELKAAKQANTEELLHRIQQKQEESMRRHEENLEQIKQRASEMSTPRSSSAVFGGDLSSIISDGSRPPSCRPYSKQKLCTLCNILIPSDVHLLAHLKGKRHSVILEDALPGKTLPKESAELESHKCIVEASDEKVQALSPSTVMAIDRLRSNRKRRQRVRQKLQAKAKEYMTNVTKSSTPSWQSSPHLQKMLKAQRDIGRCLENCGLDKQWLSADVHALERAVGELTRIMSQQDCSKEQEAFHGCKIADQALLLLSILEKQNACDVTRLPLRSLMNVCNMLKTSISKNRVTALEMLYSNKIGSCIDALAFQLQNLKQDGKQSVNQKSMPKETVIVQLCSLLMVELEEIFNILENGGFDNCHSGEDGFRSRVSLMISYIVACGIVDQFGAYYTSIVDLPVEGVQYDVAYNGLRLITTILKTLLLNIGKPVTSVEDTTQFLDALRCAELCNLMPILYSLLLGPNMTSSTDRQTPPKLPESVVNFIEVALDLVNFTGAASRQLLQDILGQEDSSLEFRHVASFLISYGNRHDCQTILHRIIVSVGYFTALNNENQALVHFGNQPSILQQLCILPFGYFSEKKLTRILFPTLIACSYQNSANRYLCEQELSCVLLSDFIKQRMSNDQTHINIVDDDFYGLQWRFSKKEWTNAMEYFESPLPQ